MNAIVYMMSATGMMRSQRTEIRAGAGLSLPFCCCAVIVKTVELPMARLSPTTNVRQSVSAGGD